MPWSELERKLSGRPVKPPPENTDHDSAPGWSQKRAAYEPSPRAQRPSGPVVPYAELHCHSNFSFLDGASDPEELIEEAVGLGLSA